MSTEDVEFDSVSNDGRDNTVVDDDTTITGSVVNDVVMFWAFGWRAVVDEISRNIAEVEKCACEQILTEWHWLCHLHGGHEFEQRPPLQGIVFLSG